MMKWLAAWRRIRGNKTNASGGGGGTPNLWNDPIAKWNDLTTIWNQT